MYSVLKCLSYQVYQGCYKSHNVKGERDKGRGGPGGEQAPHQSPTQTLTDPPLYYMYLPMLGATYMWLYTGRTSPPPNHAAATTTTTAYRLPPTPTPTPTAYHLPPRTLPNTSAYNSVHSFPPTSTVSTVSYLFIFAAILCLAGRTEHYNAPPPPDPQPTLNRHDTADAFDTHPSSLPSTTAVLGEPNHYYRIDPLLYAIRHSTDKHCHVLGLYLDLNRLRQQYIELQSIRYSCRPHE